MNQEITNEDYTSKELKKYNLADAKIAEIKSKFLPLKVKDSKDQINYDLCKSSHQEVRTIRLGIEDTRKRLKASSLEFGRKVDAEARRLTKEIVEIEEHLLAQRKVVEDEQKRIEDERRAKIEAEEEAERLEEEERQEAEKKAEEERLEKIRQEQEANQKALDAKQAELDAKEAKIKADQDKIEADKQKAIEIEEAKKKAAERAKLEAENKARKEKEDAEIAAKNKEMKIQLEKERLEEELRNQIECPKCHHKFQRQ